MLTNVETFVDQHKQVVNAYINEHFSQVSATELGLDRRAGNRLYVNNEAVAVEDNGRTQLDFYGAFEDVQGSSRIEFNGFTFYLRDNSLVLQHIKFWQKELDSTYSAT